MIIFPAIDLYEGKAVRLLRGDYAQMTVYSDHPEEIGNDFAAKGATHVHLVDLEGARDGTTPNLDTVLRIRESTGLFCEIGGGIRSMETVNTYLKAVGGGGGPAFPGKRGGKVHGEDCRGRGRPRRLCRRERLDGEFKTVLHGFLQGDGNPWREDADLY